MTQSAPSKSKPGSATPMAGALALMIEFREEVAVVLCMVVFACSAAFVLVETLAADLARPTGSLATTKRTTTTKSCESAPARTSVPAAAGAGVETESGRRQRRARASSLARREPSALSEACAPRRGDSPTKRTTTTKSCESAPARTSGPAAAGAGVETESGSRQRRARASKPRARTALPTAGGPAIPSTAAADARGSSAQSRSSPETVAATLLPSATVPEDKCLCRKESQVSPWLACSDFRAAVTESLQVECESLPVDDALAFEDATRNICEHAYEPCGSSWSATEDQDEDTRPGPSASSARPRSTCTLSITLHASLPHASAKRGGLPASASIEFPEDGSPPQFHFRRNGVTAAFLVLDGESVTVSLITTPSPKAERGAAPNVSQWLKLSHAEGACDVYAFADLGWRALLPHLYT